MNSDEEKLRRLALEEPSEELHARMQGLFDEAISTSPSGPVLKLSHALAACALCAALGAAGAATILRTPPAVPAPVHVVYVERPAGPHGANPFDWNRLPVPALWDAPAMPAAAVLPSDPDAPPA